MGGYGSTRWAWHTRKERVEDSFQLPISMFSAAINQLITEGMGLRSRHVSWSTRGEQTGRIGVLLVKPQHEPPIARLVYQASSQGVNDRITLATTQPNYGGARWWWLCPSCGQRCGVLYLPASSRHFRCRCCHDLMYTSAQEHDPRVSRLLKSSSAEIDALSSQDWGYAWIWIKAVEIKRKRMERATRRLLRGR